MRRAFVLNPAQAFHRCAEARAIGSRNAGTDRSIYAGPARKSVREPWSAAQDRETPRHNIIDALVLGWDFPTKVEARMECDGLSVTIQAGIAVRSRPREKLS